MKHQNPYEGAPGAPNIGAASGRSILPGALLKILLSGFAGGLCIKIYIQDSSPTYSPDAPSIHTVDSNKI